MLASAAPGSLWQAVLSLILCLKKNKIKQGRFALYVLLSSKCVLLTHLTSTMNWKQKLKRCMSTLAARNMCGLPLILSITEKGIQSIRLPLPSTTEESLCTYCLSTEQECLQTGRCTVNAVQGKPREQASLRSTTFLPSLNTPLGTCTLLYRVWPLVNNKP